ISPPLGTSGRKLTAPALRPVAGNPWPAGPEKTGARRLEGMGTLMDNNSAESVDLIERARAGDREALNTLLARHRDRLRRMVEIRLDTRLQARLDASDV